MVTLDCEEHPLFVAHAVRCVFPEPLGQLARSADLEAGLEAAVASADEERRGLVRAMLRHGGYKPSGRGKPSSEYLARVVVEGSLPRINPAVDLGNLASAESGLPISVVDLGRTAGTALRTACAVEGASYVFNASGQEIDLKGLLCLFDAEGPCANAVKDAQRTKTAEDSTDCLFIVWCPAAAAEAGAAVLSRLAAGAQAMGAATELVAGSLAG